MNTKDKADKVDHALRVERDTLRFVPQSNAIANALNHYIQNADEDSKARFYDLVMALGDIQPPEIMEVGLKTTVTTETEVSWEAVANAWIGAIEGGYSPWLVGVAHGADDNSVLLANAAKGKGTVWYADPEYWANGGALIADHDDPDTGDDGDGSAQTLVTRKMISEGLQHMAEKSPGHFGDMVSENDDAYTHDAFVQYVILKDIVYG